MALTTTDFSSYFKYDEATKQVTFTDITDYAGQGVALADVDVLIKCETASGGIFYNNVSLGSPDIDPNVSLDSAIVIPVPLGVDSLPLQDDYTFTFKSYVSSVLTVTKVKTFTLDYTRPVVDIEMEVDCITPRLTATDETNYTVDGINPTITRDFKIHYPSAANRSDVTGAGVSVYTPSDAAFYTIADTTVEHSSSLTSTLRYNFTGGFYVDDEVEGNKFIQVSCPLDVCQIFCCKKTLIDRYLAVKQENKNDVLARMIGEKVALVFYLSSLVEDAIVCGKTSLISKYTAIILDLAECNAGCGCGEDTLQLATGLGGSSSSVVVDNGTGISVYFAGNTYTVSLSAANIAKLAATYNTVVAAGTNVTSVTSNTIVAGNVTTTTYTVNATDTVVESLFVSIPFSFSSGSLPSYSIGSQKLYGTVFRNGLTDALGIVPFIEISNIGSASDWQNNTVTMKVQKFFSGSSVDFYPEVHLVEERLRNSKAILTQSKKFLVDIYDIDADYFKIRFINGTLGAASGVELDGLNSLKLIFKLNA